MVAQPSELSFIAFMHFHGRNRWMADVIITASDMDQNAFSRIYMSSFSKYVTTFHYGRFNYNIKGSFFPAMRMLILPIASRISGFFVHPHRYMSAFSVHMANRAISIAYYSVG